MASTRLAISIKDTLVSKLVEHAFTKRAKDLIEKELAFAQKVYDEVMDTKIVTYDNGKQKTMKQALKALPKRWRSTDDDFQVEFAGQCQQIHKYNGLSRSFSENKNLPGVAVVPSSERTSWDFEPNQSSYRAMAQFDASHELSIQFTELSNARKDLLEEIASAKRSARATMDSCATVQKLIVLWPEVKQFAAQFLTQEKAAAVMLPIVAREKLNAALDLPPNAEAA